jgi:hypothetical protein
VKSIQGVTRTTQQIRAEYAYDDFDNTLRESMLAEFDLWLAAFEAEIRADEREKAAQRVTNEFVSEGPVAVTHPVVQRAIAAARGGEQA